MPRGFLSNRVCPISVASAPYPNSCSDLFPEGSVIAPPARDQFAGIIRPSPRRSQMVHSRVFVFATCSGLSARNQLPILVKITLYYIAVGISPFRDQFAARAVLESRRHSIHHNSLRSD